MECEKLNWESKMEKTDKLIHLWKKRNLSIIGKILIIKTLILPIFTFLASACVVPEQYVKEIESKCFKFIWDEKPDKVKRAVLCAPYTNGGLQMVNFFSYFKALKASWVNRLVHPSPANWKLIPQKYFGVLGKNWLIFKLNLDNKKILDYIRNIPCFYKEVLKSWIFAGGGQTKTPKTFSDIRKQIIWGNKYITHKNDYVIFQNWIKSDIIFINDIIGNDGNISYEYIFTKLINKSNWIAEYSILRQSLPREWIVKLRSEDSIKSFVNTRRDKFRFDGKYADFSLLDNKCYYNIIVSKKLEMSIGVQRWLRELSEENTSFKHLFIFIFSILEDNRLKMYKWKLSQYILPNKKLLFQWKLSNDNLCNFCKQEENYEHFFISCKYLSDFWRKIYQILEKSGIKNTVTFKPLVIGYIRQRF